MIEYNSESLWTLENKIKNLLFEDYVNTHRNDYIYKSWKWKILQLPLNMISFFIATEQRNLPDNGFGDQDQYHAHRKS